MNVGTLLERQIRTLEHYLRDKEEHRNITRATEKNAITKETTESAGTLSEIYWRTAVKTYSERLASNLVFYYQT